MECPRYVATFAILCTVATGCLCRRSSGQQPRMNGCAKIQRLMKMLQLRRLLTHLIIRLMQKGLFEKSNSSPVLSDFDIFVVGAKKPLLLVGFIVHNTHGV